MRILFLSLFFLSTQWVFSQKINIDSLPAPTFDEGPFYLVFEDSFDGDSIDIEKWEVKHGHLRGLDIEMQMYTPNNIEVSNGTLKLWARKEVTTGPCKSGGGRGIAWNEPITKNYSSGEIDSKRLFLYGKFEAKLKCPTGKKFWPAFWLQKGGGDKLNYCEIDIVEAWGTSHANCTVHDFGGSKKPHTMRPHNYSDFEFDTWHTYTTIWTPFKIQFFFDGNFVTEVFHYTEKNNKKGLEYQEISEKTELLENLWPYPNPSNVIFNFALDSILPGNPDTFLPACFEVDYVKIWQRMPDFQLEGPASIAKNSTEPQTYTLPFIEGASYTWDYPQRWTGTANNNLLTVTPDSTKGGNLSVIISFKDGQQLVKDVNVGRY